MKYFLIFFCALILTSCSVQPIQSLPKLSEIEVAQKAISIQDWESAYRFLEEGFVSTQSEVKSQAIKLAEQYPQILVAGANTFSFSSIFDTLSTMAKNFGQSMIIERLERYKVVATLEDYKNAKSNYDLAVLNIKQKWKAAEDNERRQEELREDNDRRQKELQEEERRNRSIKQRLLIDAKENSRVFCQNFGECEKAFALTQIYISEKSDMKIQVATGSVIETFNPTDSMKIGLKAIKIPRQGNSAEIVLTVSCRYEGSVSFDDVCDSKLLSTYHGFPAFVKSALKP